jgi:hypothetical protein
MPSVERLELDSVVGGAMMLLATENPFAVT